MALIIASIKVPMHVYFKGKKYHLNLNEYVKWNKYLRNDLKKAYAFSLIPIISRMKKINVVFKERATIFKDSKRRYDVVDNPIIVFKFLNDALVSYGIIEDDNSDCAPKSEMEHGGYVKEDSYAIIDFLNYVPRISFQLETLEGLYLW